MSQPQFCRNPECPYARVAPTGWFVRDGTYWCKAHGRDLHCSPNAVANAVVRLARVA